MTDYSTMTGAQFRREVGTDPQKWAREFLVAYAAAHYDAVKTQDDREAFVTQWFRDAMNAAGNAALAQDTHDSGRVRYGAGMMQF